MKPEFVEGLRRQLDDAEADLLAAVLADLAEEVHTILGDTLAGVYMKGSFALGSGDIHSDVDFLVATHHRLDAAQEKAIRDLHRVLPDREEHWAHNLEGSYVSLDDLHQRANPGTPWLYVDNGNRDMEWSAHDNTEGFRWVLHNRALAVHGPAAATLIHDVPPPVLRHGAAALAVRRRQDIAADLDYLSNGWGQPHEVLTRCRLLYTATRAEVIGKMDAAQWAKNLVPSEWHHLIDRAIADRPNPWQRVHQSADPVLAERTWEFVEFITPLIAKPLPRPSRNPSPNPVPPQSLPGTSTQHPQASQLCHARSVSGSTALRSLNCRRADVAVWTETRESVEQNALNRSRMSDMLVSVALGAMGNVIADAIAAMGAHGHYRRDPERRALSTVVARASSEAFADARHRQVLPTSDWIDSVAEQWTPAFTLEVVAELLEVIATPSADNQLRFVELIRGALTEAGCDLDTLEQAISIEEFAHAFPARLWHGLDHAALAQPNLRELAGFLRDRRAGHRESALRPTGPRDYRHDLSAYLEGILREAHDELPQFLPRDRVTKLHQRARVRFKSRRAGRKVLRQRDDVYRPPVEFAGLPENDPGTEPWEQLRKTTDQVVVLSDPGLGKSWLVRNETIRLAQEALDVLREDRLAVVPVPIRADQLAAASGRSVGDIAAQHFVTSGRLAARSRAHFAEQIDAGRVYLLIDGLDEVPDDSGRRRIHTALADWCRLPGERRLIMTSRIAGYTPVQLPDQTEIELLSLTVDQVQAYVRSWGLEPPAEARLLAAVAESAVSGMARIPLLLALLCSLAGSVEDIPRTRTDLYERVLFWFLEGPHRSTGRSGRDNETLLELIANVAFDFAHGEHGWADLMPRSSLTAAVRRQPLLSHLSYSPEQLVDHLAVDLGLIVPEGDASGGRQSRYLFVHRTFAEYLAARHLANLGEQRRWAVLKRHLWFDPEWIQVISMLGGRLDSGETGRLVAALCEVADDAFRQAFLIAIRVVSEHPESDGVLTPDARRGLERSLTAALRHPDLRWRVVTALRGVPVLAPAVVGALLRLAEVDDKDVRIAAIQSLAGVETPDPAGHLIVALRDEESRVAVAAAEAMAGRASPAVVNALLAETSSDDPRVARACVDALAALPGALRVRAVTPYLTPDQPAAIRIATFPVLRGVGSVALPVIGTGLADEDPDVFCAAADSWDGPLDHATEAALLRRIERKTGTDADPIEWNGPIGRHRDRDARAARQALARGGSQAPGFTAAYLREVIDDEDPLSHLGVDAIPTAPNASLIRELLVRLRGPARLPQRKAADVLGKIRPDGIDDALVALLADADRETIIAVLKAAHGRRDDRLLAQVIALLNHPDDDIRADAYAFVVEQKPAGMDEILLAGLRDTSQVIRGEAARACAGRSDPRLVPALLERIRLSEESTNVVVSAIRALQDRQDPGVRDALLTCLRRDAGGSSAESPDSPSPDATRRRLFVYLGPPIYAAAAEALAEAEPEAALAAVKAHSDPMNGYVVREILPSLTRCESPNIVDLLLEIRRHGSRKARIAAHHALIERPFSADLVRLADRLDGLPPEMLHDMVQVTGALAAQHFMDLPEDLRQHVRASLTRAVTAGERTG